jgi:hypothetical protein
LVSLGHPKASSLHLTAKEYILPRFKDILHCTESLNFLKLGLKIRNVFIWISDLPSR